jgi:hypothetical protein
MVDEPKINFFGGILHGCEQFRYVCINIYLYTHIKVVWGFLRAFRWSAEWEFPRWFEGEVLIK